jgi:hypothetical protein
MIENSRRPGVACVAVVAYLVALNMIARFALRGLPIVAGKTAALNLRVVYTADDTEGIGVVAVFANISGLYMCWVFPCRCTAVVAAETIAAD